MFDKSFLDHQFQSKLSQQYQSLSQFDSFKLHSSRKFEFQQMLYQQKACGEDVHMTMFVPPAGDDVHVSTAYKQKINKIKPVDLEKDLKKVPIEESE